MEHRRRRNYEVSQQNRINTVTPAVNFSTYPMCRGMAMWEWKRISVIIRSDIAERLLIK
jgi:hypothetical protein